jgi:lipopolysaccharide biosynthesis regulator YciM
MLFFIRQLAEKYGSSSLIENVQQEEGQMVQVARGWYTIYGYRTLFEAVTDLRGRNYTSSEIQELQDMAHAEMGQPILDRTQYHCPSCRNRYPKKWWETLGCPGCGHHET